MSLYTLPPVQYLALPNKVRICYRTIPARQPSSKPPLVLHIHFRANLTLWDPVLLYHLSYSQTLIVFDQPGTGRSTGVVPESYHGWADDLILFIDTLSLKQIDLAGFSMGGRAVQMVTLKRPDLVRKLILAGTDASQPPKLDSDSSEVRWPRGGQPPEPIKLLRTAQTQSEAEEAIRVSFFPPGGRGEEAAARYWERVRRAARDSGDEESSLMLLGEEGTKRQYATVVEWANGEGKGSWERLGELRCPVLVMNGDDDLLVSLSFLPIFMILEGEKYKSTPSNVWLAHL